MEPIEIIELIGVSLALIFGIISCVYSSKANQSSKESNEISNKSIAIAEKANLISAKSLKIAEEASNMNKENVEFESPFNPIIIKNTSENKLIFENDYDNNYGQFFILLTIQAKNKSLQPVTINKLSASIGAGDNSSFIYSGDILNIKSYKNKEVKDIVSFPLYLNGNQSKEFSFAIAINNSDYQQYYAKNGVEISFYTTNSYKNLHIHSSETIEYL